MGNNCKTWTEGGMADADLIEAQLSRRRRHENANHQSVPVRGWMQGGMADANLIEAQSRQNHQRHEDSNHQRVPVRGWMQGGMADTNLIAAQSRPPHHRNHETAIGGWIRGTAPPTGPLTASNLTTNPPPRAPPPTGPPATISDDLELEVRKARAKRIQALSEGHVLQTKRKEDVDNSAEMMACFDDTIRAFTNKTCAICLMEYDHGEAVSKSQTKKCKHMFHKECIADWLAQGNENCPCCRTEYLTPTLSIRGVGASGINGEIQFPA